VRPKSSQDKERGKKREKTFFVGKYKPDSIWGVGENGGGAWGGTSETKGEKGADLHLT